MNPPVKNIAHGRLAGFESVKAGQDAAVDDAAKTWDVRKFLRVRPDRNVAGAGTDDFYQRTGSDPGADGAQMRVKRADGNRKASTQTGFLRPGRRQTAHGGIHRPHPRAKAFAQRAELGIQLQKEFSIRITAPA